MRLVYFGTPAASVPPLRALPRAGHEIAFVVTQPDRRRGRGNAVVPSPVKEAAVELGLPVFTPRRAREVIDDVASSGAELGVVVAFGRLIKPHVLDRLPMINVHFSLLPRWRGAAPIQAAILAGDTETGISIMRIVKRMDAGNVLLQVPTPILDDETYGELQLRLSELGALAIVEALTLLSLGPIAEVVQDEARVTFASKIEREQAQVDWTQDGHAVSRRVRAYDPRPGAWTLQRGLEVKLYGVRVAMDARGEPGAVLAIDESGMLVACGSGGVRISYVHPAGKRRLASLDWSQGRGVAVGDVLGAPA